MELENLPIHWIHSNRSKTMQTGVDDTAVFRPNNFTSTFVIYITAMVHRKYFRRDCLKYSAFWKRGGKLILILDANCFIESLQEMFHRLLGPPKCQQYLDDAILRLKQTRFTQLFKCATKNQNPMLLLPKKKPRLSPNIARGTTDQQGNRVYN